MIKTEIHLENFKLVDLSAAVIAAIVTSVYISQVDPGLNLVELHTVEWQM